MSRDSSSFLRFLHTSQPKFWSATYQRQLWGKSGFMDTNQDKLLRKLTPGEIAMAGSKLEAQRYGRWVSIRRGCICVLVGVILAQVLIKALTDTTMGILAVCLFVIPPLILSIWAGWRANLHKARSIFLWNSLYSGECTKLFGDDNE